MNKALILILFFLPLTLIGQDLDCCKTKKEVETFLNGIWKKNDSDLNNLYQYKFDEGKGEFRVFRMSDDGTLEVISNSESNLTVIKTENGFTIEHDWGKLKTYSSIKYLDSTKLIVTREDGKESLLFRVLE